MAYAALERTGWPLGAMVSYAEANTYVQRQLGRTVLIGFIFLVAAFAVGSIVTNRMLVRPVLQLAAAAKKISEGDFTSEVQLQKKTSWECWPRHFELSSGSWAGSSAN